jgi:hypothetical protein
MKSLTSMLRVFAAAAIGSVVSGLVQAQDAPQGDIANGKPLRPAVCPKIESFFWHAPSLICRTV